VAEPSRSPGNLPGVTLRVNGGALPPTLLTDLADVRACLGLRAHRYDHATADRIREVRDYFTPVPPAAVQIAYRWYDTATGLEVPSGSAHRTHLPRTIFPNDRVGMHAIVIAPKEIGAFELRIGLVQTLAGTAHLTFAEGVLSGVVRVE
jgi:hypothetical protein